MAARVPHQRHHTLHSDSRKTPYGRSAVPPNWRLQIRPGRRPTVTMAGPRTTDEGWLFRQGPKARTFAFTAGPVATTVACHAATAPTHRSTRDRDREHASALSRIIRDRRPPVVGSRSTAGGEPAGYCGLLLRIYGRRCFVSQQMRTRHRIQDGRKSASQTDAIEFISKGGGHHRPKMSVCKSLTYC